MDCLVSVDLVPVSTIMVLFRVSANTIRRWRKEERLPFLVVVGNENDIILYNWTAVLAWSREKKTMAYVDAALEFQRKRSKKWEALQNL